MAHPKAQVCTEPRTLDSIMSAASSSNDKTEDAGQSSSDAGDEEQPYIPFESLSVELEEGEGSVSGDGISYNTTDGEGNVKTTANQLEDTDDNANAEFEPSFFMEQELLEPETRETYLQDFLLTDSSSNMAQDGDSSVSEGLPLSRIPNIVKSVQAADYSTLQVLYRLIYMRNAWDTENILAQRILEFSGLTCGPGSEDYYEREIMLRMLPNDTIEKIGKLLACSSNIEDEKNKNELQAEIIKFLHKPQLVKTCRVRPRRTLKKKLKETTNSNNARHTAEKPSSPITINKENEERTSRIQIKNDSTDSSSAGSILEIHNDDSTNSTLEQASDVNVTNASPEENENKGKKKLKDFSLVVSSVEGTPEELLQELHFVMYLKKNDKFKEQIFEFDGFEFATESEEYQRRVDHLKTLPDNTVKNLVRALYIDPKNDVDATITLLMTFLHEPDDSFLKPANIASGFLSDCDIDLSSLSDSDSDSIIVEFVPKHFECIDLLSSGEDSDIEKVDLCVIKKEPAQITKPAIKEPEIKSTATTSSMTITKTMPPLAKILPKPVPLSSSIRRLRDFQTITKIVNTHPMEYLVDIYKLLYMKEHDPKTLRKEILEFSGFMFDKSSPEYVKRRQYLDRMAYNCARRIYNTLIHNTREVKVFSKPTMIIEIFQFLFKLPDTDTSLRLPILPSAPNVSQSVPVESLNSVMPRGLSSLLSSPGKLSELKRVFQRVACFPCEYLIDVHKLLFMKDCPMEDIRANIFAFKGFKFGVDSNDFNQRKIFLEYLTFHSLRKISSVLTTKTVDLRNSTKHELAHHLTEVLKEYTNINLDDAAREKAGNNNAVTSQQLSLPDTGVEEIVVTPIIQPLDSSPVPSPEPPKDSYPYESNVDIVSSSTSNDNHDVSIECMDRIEISNVKSAAFDQAPPQSQSGSENADPLLFEDINLPELENYKKLYNKNTPRTIAVLNEKTDLQAVVNPINPPQQTFVLQQVPSFSPVMPQMHLPFIQFPATTFSSTLQIPSTTLVMPQNSPIAKVDSTVKDISRKKKLSPAFDVIVGALPSKHRKIAPKTADTASNASVTEKKDDLQSTPSLQNKIRDAMIMTSEDEEDCDKPLSSLLGHPNDKVLKQQICEIVEKTSLQEITINEVIQKIFGMYPKFDLNYRKDFIKSVLRSLLYRLGDPNESKDFESSPSFSPDCCVSTTNQIDSPQPIKESSTDDQTEKPWEESTPVIEKEEEC